MFIQILIAIIIGVTFGIFTGLTPGIHINLISIILLSLSGYFLDFTTPVVLCVFIIAMSVTHTFLNHIPSVFLGAPDADTALGVLPGHKLLMQGKGYEAVKLTVIGSLLSLVVTIILISIVLPFLPLFYGYIEPYMGKILIGVVIFMLLKEQGINKKMWGFVVFMLSGILGMTVFSIPNLKQPLFPMLSGMFGISTLLISLSDNSEIPLQKTTGTIKVSPLNTLKAVLAAVFSGSLTGIFPGLGSATAAIIAMQIVGEIGMYGFIILIGGVNTVNFIFSIATFYTMQKARNGAIVAVLEIISSIGREELWLFLAVALIAGGIATFLALSITKAFSFLISRINYRWLCVGIIGLILVLTSHFSGLVGFLVLLTSTALGIIPAQIGVKRSNAMGCLLVINIIPKSL
jgi:putative membrane protein